VTILSTVRLRRAVFQGRYLTPALLFIQHSPSLCDGRMWQIAGRNHMTLLGKKPSLMRALRQGARALTDKRIDPTGAPVRSVAVLGHRGAPRQAAENTVVGCQRAIDQDADGVEVDVCVTRDGQVVLWHDRDPDPEILLLRGAVEQHAFAPRGSSERRPVTELDWSDFRTKFGLEHRVEGTAAAIDTLDRLIAWAAGEPRASWLMLDIKLVAEEVEFVPKLLARLAESIRAFPDVRSRNLRLLTPQREIYGALEEGLRAHPALDFCQLTADFELAGVVEVAREIGARHVAIGLTPTRPWALVRQDLTDAIQARSAGDFESVTVWTLDEEDALAEAIALGVDALLTDDVPAARRLAGPRVRPR
jgi:glycerophosphoryl diester phosphodiesterase